MKKLLFTLSFGLLFLCFSCMETIEMETPTIDPGSQKDPVTEAVLIKETNSLVANPDIKVLTSENTTFQGSLDEIKSGTVKVISESYDKFNVGDVLAIAYEGTVIFQKVEEAEGRNGEFVIMTSPAVLTDIIMDGTVETRINLVEAARQKMIETKAPDDFIKPYLFYIGQDFTLDIDNFLNFKPGMHWGIYMGMKLDFKLFKPLMITTYTELDFGYSITGSMKEGDHKVYEKDLAPLVPSFILNYVESLEVPYTLDLVGIENLGDLSMDLVISVKDIHVPLMIESMAMADVEFEFSYDANLQVGTKTTIGKTIEVEQFMEKEIKEPVHYFKNDLNGYLNMEVGLTAATDIEVKAVRLENPTGLAETVENLLDITSKLTRDYTGLAEVMFVTKNSGSLTPELSFASSGVLDTKFTMDIPSIVLLEILGADLLNLQTILGDKYAALDEDNVLWEIGQPNVPVKEITVTLMPEEYEATLTNKKLPSSTSRFFIADVVLNFDYQYEFPYSQLTSDPVSIEYYILKEGSAGDATGAMGMAQNIVPTNITENGSFTLAFESLWEATSHSLGGTRAYYTPDSKTIMKNVKLTFKDGTTVDVVGEVELEVEIPEAPTVTAIDGTVDCAWNGLEREKPANNIGTENYYKYPLTLNFDCDYEDGQIFPSDTKMIYMTFKPKDSGGNVYADGVFGLGGKYLLEGEITPTYNGPQPTGFSISTTQIPWRSFYKLTGAIGVGAFDYYLPHRSITLSEMEIVFENGVVMSVGGTFDLEIKDYPEPLTAKFSQIKSTTIQSIPEGKTHATATEMAVFSPKYSMDVELVFTCNNMVEEGDLLDLKYGSILPTTLTNLVPIINKENNTITLKLTGIQWDAITQKSNCKKEGSWIKIEYCDYAIVSPEPSITLSNVQLIHNDSNVNIGSINLNYIE